MQLRLKRLFLKTNISFVRKLLVNIPQRFRFKILFSLGLLSFLLFALTVTVDLLQKPQNTGGKAATAPSPTPPFFYWRCDLEGEWRHYCVGQEDVCKQQGQPNKAVGIPYRCEQGKWVNRNRYGECTDKCFTKTPTPFPTLTPSPTPFLPTPIPTSSPNPTKIPLPTPTPKTYFEIPVLILNYFPLDKNNQAKIDTGITGTDLPKGTSLKEVRQKVNRLTYELTIGLEKGSSYHGYKDINSQPALKYNIIETKEFLRPILRTDNISWGFTADHLNELTNINICNYVENRGIKEVWLWMYHYTPDLNGDGQPDKDANRYFVAPAESNMAGPYGDISNSDRYADLPVCSKTYTVYEYNYGRGFGEAIEDHGHQIEEVFNYVDYSIWNKFVGGVTSPLACGRTHCPPNVMDICSSHNYDWANERSTLSDCEDWKIDRSGATKTISCHTWAGAYCGSNSGDKFKIWWMQNIARNWWIYLGDFDRAVREKRGLNQ